MEVSICQRFAHRLTTNGHLVVPNSVPVGFIGGLEWISPMMAKGMTILPRRCNMRSSAGWSISSLPSGHKTLLKVTDSRQVDLYSCGNGLWVVRGCQSIPRLCHAVQGSMSAWQLREMWDWHPPCRGRVVLLKHQWTQFTHQVSLATFARAFIEHHMHLRNLLVPCVRMAVALKHSLNSLLTFACTKFQRTTNSHSHINCLNLSIKIEKKIGISFVAW